MKQLGNLAMVCAKRPELLMTLHEGRVTVFAGAGPDRAVMCCAWDNDAEINRMVYELNFGKYARKGL